MCGHNGVVARHKEANSEAEALHGEEIRRHAERPNPEDGVEVDLRRCGSDHPDEANDAEDAVGLPLPAARRLEQVEAVAVKLNCVERREDEAHRDADRSRRYEVMITNETYTYTHSS